MDARSEYFLVLLGVTKTIGSKMIVDIMIKGYSVTLCNVKLKRVRFGEIPPINIDGIGKHYRVSLVMNYHTN